MILRLRRKIRSHTVLVLGGLLLVFLVTVVALLFVFGAEHFVLPLSLKDALHTVRIPFTELNTLLGTGQITVDAYTITQTYKAEPLHVPLYYAHLYLLLLIIAYALILAALTHVRGFTFFVGLGIWTCVFYTFNFHHLRVFGWQSYEAFLLLGLPVVGTAVLLQRYDWLSLWQRFAMFLLLFLLSALLIHYAAEEAHPFYMLAHYGYSGSMGLTILFSFVCAHEIIYLILWMSLSAQKRSSLLHFGINSGLYLGYLVLAYCKNLQLINWDIIYLNPFILFMFSSLIGFWGLRQQQPLYGAFLPYDPFLLVAYIGFYIIAMSTVAFHFSHLNTPAIEVIEDAVIFGHMSFGICFLFYLFNMFKIPIARGLPVWKVVYRERNVQYVRLAGLLFIITLAYVGNYASYHQFFSGYYNGLGDLYKRKENKTLARGYYRAGVGRAYNNYKSNSELGAYYKQNNNPAKAALYYQRANEKHPTSSSYLVLSDVFQQDHAYFRSVFSLQQGLEDFPHNPLLHNNLGVLFAQKNYTDSALYHLKRGALRRRAAAVSRGNLSFLYNEYPHLITQEEVAQGLKNAETAPEWNNWLVLGLQKDAVPASFSLSSVPIRADHRVAAYNQTLAAIKVDAPNVDELLLSYGKERKYDRSARFLCALRAYEQGRMSKALRTMDALQASASGDRGYFLSIMGRWVMQAGAYAAAADFFNRAYKAGYTACLPHYFLSHLQSGNTELLRDFLAHHRTPDDEALARWMALTRGFLRQGHRAWRDENPHDHEALTIYWALRGARLSWRERERIIQLLGENKAQKAALWLHSARRFMRVEDYDTAARCLRRAQQEGVPASSASYEKMVRYLEANIVLLRVPAPTSAQNLIVTELRRRLSDDRIPVDSLVSIGKDNVFEEGVVLSIVEALNRRNSHHAAYEVLLEGIELHSSSNSLLKAYALQALHMRVEAYGQRALEALKERLERKNFDVFHERYVRLQEQVNREDTW